MTKVTGYFVMLLIVATVVYDVVAYQSGGTEATISWQVAAYVYKQPVVAFAAGFVCGHLFWQMKPKKQGLDE